MVKKPSRSVRFVSVIVHMLICCCVINSNKFVSLLGLHFNPLMLCVLIFKDKKASLILKATAGLTSRCCRARKVLRSLFKEDRWVELFVIGGSVLCCGMCISLKKSCACGHGILCSVCSCLRLCCPILVTLEIEEVVEEIGVELVDTQFVSG